MNKENLEMIGLQQYIASNIFHSPTGIPHVDDIATFATRYIGSVGMSDPVALDSDEAGTPKTNSSSRYHSLRKLIIKKTGISSPTRCKHQNTI